MWNGSFSPTLTKALASIKWEPLRDGDDPFGTYIVDEADVDDPEFSSDVIDAEPKLEIEDRNPGPNAKRSWSEDEKPDAQRGILWVQFSWATEFYGFPCRFKKYIEFRDTSFSRAWLNKNYPIRHVGDWGWPWGRIEGSGWWEGNTIMPKGKNGRYNTGGKVDSRN